ncbi:ATP-dependent DNA ligase [Cellulomonas triticagri]|uniref:DNA ligase (ATP) n=1 Tax=Cellulomonas triticagri TaxID=2483352 RepID=A0A3M2IZ80_9CELL|nr:DNA ligase [Cellulomonas triticagri]RMI04970.1 DNA ligase [Cellulomonas triticagri]
MLATPAPVRSGTSVLPEGAGWRFEVKWDGVRVLASVPDGGGARLRLLGRAGNDAAAAYPELGGLAALPPGTVLDGEVVAMRDGVPSFAALAERMHVRDPARAAALARRLPVTYVVFDVLALAGTDLTARPWTERRAALDDLALPERVQRSPVYADGDLIWDATRAQGLEGVVAKRATATYQAGRRSTDWVKAVHRRTRTALVGGWRPESTGSGRLGAVLLGAPDATGALRYLGRAGSGLTGSLARDLTERLRDAPRPDPPFADTVDPVDARGTVWVEPRVLLDVRYLARGPSGRLRQPVLRGRRDDTDVDPWEAP